MSSTGPVSDIDGTSLDEAALARERVPLTRKAAEERGCCHGVVGGSLVACLKGEGERPSLPEPKRPDVPLSHNQYELQKCFPCAYHPLHYFLLDRLPFLRWFFQYNLRWLLSDVVAGLTVGLMVVPQALAYAKIANLRLKVSVLHCLWCAHATPRLANLYYGVSF